MKIRINKYNKDAYINTLCESLKRFIDFCNSYEDNRTYTYYKSMAEKLLSGDYNNISLNVLQFCFEPEYVNTTIYPEKMLHSLYSFRDYAYNTDIQLLSIQEQQERAKNYIHFDFSIKRPKILKEI